MKLKMVVVLLMMVCAHLSLSAKMLFATGYSENKDLKVAGQEAAQQIKKKFGKERPKLVIVSVITNNKKVDLSGVLANFDKNIVFGSSNAGVITTDKVIESGIAILAFAGDVDVKTAFASLDKKGNKCGKNLGEQILKQGGLKKDGQNLCIVAGDCHHPKNNFIAQGIMAKLGKQLPIVGAAADGPKLVIYKGEVKFNGAIALLINSEFKVGYGMAGSGARDEKELLEMADKSVKSAVAENAPELLLMFDCAGRRRALRKHNAIGKEFDVIKKYAKNAEIFGFYGQGEVGKTSAKETSYGSGYHVSTCSISVVKEKKCNKGCSK
ncbi:FIST N-terminal domain-containing protein [Lentisphaerota bacterium WC36G]|nr:FIST C-terminal domain-containing protein [Lentisphaerae bacterium WC36]